MQSDTQSSSLTLGENLTPTSIVSHPGSESKKFYITLNPLSKSAQNQISVVELNKQQQRLSHNQIPYQGHLKDISFISETQSVVHSLNAEGKSQLQTLKDEDIENGKGKFVKVNFEFGEELNSIMPHKGGVYLQGDNDLFQFDLQKVQRTGILTFDTPIDFAAMDIIHQHLVLCASNQERKIMVVDTNTKSEKFVIQNINNSAILAIHFNPIKQYNFISVFEDCFKVWDMRKTNLPVKCWDSHHSLLLNGRYNRTHDELILTSYDDGTLGLFRVSSGSSMINKMSNNINKEEEGLVKLYDQHEDSAYLISWAAFTPWVFASVSYNANLIINEIPSALKVRILY